jgi:O-antigen ligase
LIVLPSRRVVRAGAGLLLVGAIGALAVSSTTGARRAPDVSGSVHSRQEMLQTSIRMMRDFMPVGSGFGSYRQAYQLYEQRDYVTDTYVIHAHDDYLEIAVELGLAGMLLMIAFLAWWIHAVRRAWREADADAYAKAASIASAAILVHSFFDFPLRTAAIAVVFVMCLGLLVQRRPPGAREKNQLWPTRHLVVH